MAVAHRGSCGAASGCADVVWRAIVDAWRAVVDAYAYAWRAVVDKALYAETAAASALTPLTSGALASDEGYTCQNLGK
jgi:hypothetical protein